MVVYKSASCSKTASKPADHSLQGGKRLYLYTKTLHVECAVDLLNHLQGDALVCKGG